MKLKYFAGIMVILAAGGFVAYKIFSSNKCNDKDLYYEKADDNSSVNKSEGNEKLEINESKKETQCDETMYQVYENMSVRTEQARQVLSTIHDDMKKSEENIASKKEDIAKMMENLKK